MRLIIFIREKTIVLSLHDDCEDGFVYTNLTPCSETDCLSERSNNFIFIIRIKLKIILIYNYLYTQV